MRNIIFASLFILSSTAAAQGVTSIPLKISDFGNNVFHFEKVKIPEDALSVKSVSFFVSMALDDRKVWTGEKCAEAFTRYNVNISVDGKQFAVVTDANYFRTDFSIPTYNYVQSNGITLNQLKNADGTIDVSLSLTDPVMKGYSLAVDNIAVNIFFNVAGEGNLEQYLLEAEDYWNMESFMRLLDVSIPCNQRY